MANSPLTNEPASAALSSGLAAFRYLLTVAGGVAIGRGWLDQTTLNAIIVLAVAVAPGILGAWQTYWNARAIKAAASSVPDSVINSK